MVEESGCNQTNKSSVRSKAARPRPVYNWTVQDVLKWYKRHCSEYSEYLQLFSKHDINGRALLRINDDKLQRLGIKDDEDREAIWREIIKQRLKTDIMEIRDMERNINTY